MQVAVWSYRHFKQSYFTIIVRQLLFSILAYSGLTPGFRQLLCYPLTPPSPLFCVALLIDNWTWCMNRNSHVGKSLRGCATISRGVCHSVTLSEEGY